MEIWHRTCQTRWYHAYLPMNGYCWMDHTIHQIRVIYNCYHLQTLKWCYYILSALFVVYIGLCGFNVLVISIWSQFEKNSLISSIAFFLLIQGKIFLLQMISYCAVTSTLIVWALIIFHNIFFQTNPYSKLPNLILFQFKVQDLKHLIVLSRSQKHLICVYIEIAEFAIRKSL